MQAHPWYDAMRRRSPSATTPTTAQDSEGTRIYKKALSLREKNYEASIEKFNDAADILQQELSILEQKLSSASPSSNRSEIRGVLEKLYKCYQKVWVATIVAQDDLATYYGKRATEIYQKLQKYPKN
ncbi:hypothetical protein HYU50_03625 [Candidatus Woesearchaeota archaeon]|nr:hypothetical protein [Candidatus Woesearchaeota archaeon]